MEDLVKEGPFDLLLTDTSLFQSFTAAIQCGKGRKVLQIDRNSYYGGSDAGSHKISYPNDQVNQDSFIYDPSPIIFYARGPLSSLLVSLELTEYCEFMAVEHQFIWSAQQVLIPLPLSKEQVMLEPSLTLLEKRKFSKLLGLAAVMAMSPDSTNVDSSSLVDLFNREQISPESRVFQLIAYGACRCSSLQEVNSLSLKSAVQVLESLRASLNHLNRTQSPFVLPLWGSSELSQAACRKAAVFGCIQILEKSREEVESCGIEYNETIPTLPKRTQIVRKTFLLNRPILGINGTALITIPPQCDLNPITSSTINILQLTSDSKCCPSDTWIIYMWSLEDFNENILEDDGTVLWQSLKETIQTDLLPASFTSESEFINTLTQ